MRTQNPIRKDIHDEQGVVETEKTEELPMKKEAPAPEVKVEAPPEVKAEEPLEEVVEPKEQHVTIHYGATGYSYESILSPYLLGQNRWKLKIHIFE